jgi:hypothetical protein
MKILIGILCLLFFLGGIASAQSQGYIFFAPGQLRGGGGSAFAMHFGGGGKYISHSGFGAGAELGITGPKDHFGDTCIGMASINGYYEANKSNKVRPFVTGGYDRTFARNSGANWGSFGAGLTYWAREGVGVSLEFRDHLHREFGTTFQLWTVRMGLTFK